MIPFLLAVGPFDDTPHAWAETLAPGGVSRLERALWCVVVVALVADVGLTAYGLSLGLVERNPIMRQALDVFGIAALAIGKGFALAVGLAVRARWPEYATVVPLGLALPWLVAAGINAALLASL